MLFQYDLSMRAPSFLAVRPNADVFLEVKFYVIGARKNRRILWKIKRTQ